MDTRGTYIVVDEKDAGLDRGPLSWSYLFLLHLDFMLKFSTSGPAKRQQLWWDTDLS